MPEEVPAQCKAPKDELDKCVQGKGAEGCKELLEAFEACMKGTMAAT